MPGTLSKAVVGPNEESRLLLPDQLRQYYSWQTPGARGPGLQAGSCSAYSHSSPDSFLSMVPNAILTRQNLPY